MASKKGTWKKKEAGETAWINIKINIILGIAFLLYILYKGIPLK